MDTEDLNSERTPVVEPIAVVPSPAGAIIVTSVNGLEPCPETLDTFDTDLKGANSSQQPVALDQTVHKSAQDLGLVENDAIGSDRFIERKEKPSKEQDFEGKKPQMHPFQNGGLGRLAALFTGSVMFYFGVMANLIRD